MLFENCLLFFMFNFTCCKFFALKEDHYSKQTNHLQDFPHREIKISCWIKMSHIGNPTYWEKIYISLITFRQVLKKILPAVCIQLQLWLIWKSLIKTKSLNKKQCPAGLSPRIICQLSPFLTKMSKNCFTQQVWTVSLSPEPWWEVLGIEKNPTHQPKMYSFSQSQKSSLIDLNLSPLKFHFFPIKQQFSSNHPMQPSFVAAVISIVSYFKFQGLCTHVMLIWQINVYWMLPVAWQKYWIIEVLPRPKENFHSLHLSILSFPSVLFWKLCFC